RFGIMNTDDEGKIVEFEEKPENPKSNLASMGIYIFTWDKLREYLTQDPEGMEDFGQNVIPAYLNNDKKLFAYSFDVYCIEVGTIDSLLEANMEVLDQKHPLQIQNKGLIYYSRNTITTQLF